MYIDKNYKENTKFYYWYERYMYIIAILNNIYFYIQAYQIYKDQSVETVPLFGVYLEFFVSVNFIVYGIYVKNRVLIIAGLSNFIGTLMVLILYYRYK